jgi:hypothetical protein
MTGSIRTDLKVAVYDVDLFQVTSSVITTIHAEGSKVVCSFSAGIYEDWRSDAYEFP